MDFKDKVVIITGSSSGIGAATAKLFARLSAKVVITARNQEKLNNVSKEIEANGAKPLIIKADLNNDEEIRKIVDETIKVFGKIDVLVNNAGAGLLATVRDGIEPFDKMISTNLRSVYLLTHLAIPHLIKTKGVIVNVSSIAAVRSAAKFLPYCVSKAGLDMFTKCVAEDLAADGIRVNSVNPGPVKTDFQEAAGMPEDFIEMRTKRSPLGYIATSEDVAELIVFLSSDKAKCITGSIHFIECGDLLAK